MLSFSGVERIQFTTTAWPQSTSQPQSKIMDSFPPKVPLRKEDAASASVPFTAPICVCVSSIGGWSTRRRQTTTAELVTEHSPSTKNG